MQSLNDEIEILKSIYAQDFATMPLELGFFKSIKLHLYPEIESAAEEYFVWLHLHIPKEYPNQIPKLVIEEYEGIKEEQVKELLDQLFDHSLKLSGHNMLLELITQCKEMLNEFHEKHMHSLNTQEDLYEKFKLNQKLRQEKEQRDKEAQIRKETETEKKLNALKNLDAAEENKLREKWFNTREEQKKQDGEDSDDSADGVDEYSAGCELISLKDLFTVHLLKLVSSLASRLLGVDENEFKNMIYSELKFMDMINDDALELVKKRANVIFNKLYREKQRLHTKKTKEKTTQ